MTGSTPGPWTVGEQYRQGLDVKAGSSLVAIVIGQQASYETTKANARLVAEAPAMYGLLVAAINVLDANGIVYGDCDHEPLDVLRAAREVIARIDGQEG